MTSWNPARFKQTPSWAQNPAQHSDVHHQVSDAELKRKLEAADAKEKHSWSTPDWAVVKQGNNNGSASNKPVDKSSIARPMLKVTNNGSKMVAEKPTADPAELEALQRKLAQAKLDAAKQAEAAAAVDPTANMTPEQKAKYEADARLEALRVQTEQRELEAWKQNQAERTAWEKQKRDEARAKAVAEQKAREAQEKAEREQQRAKLQAEAAAQQAKEACNLAEQRSAAPTEADLLRQQIAAIQQQLDAANGGGAAAPAAPVAAAPPAPAPIVISNNANNKHKWTKPGWALPEETIAQEASIVSDSIQNGLKAPSTGGYERKVFAKELKPPPVKGTFVKPAANKAPPPRMVWTVLNINGIKRGKIVMHLYGNADAIVDKFLELKGLECKRTADKTLFCDELEPHFYFFGGKAAQVPVKQNPSAVYGVVLEGHDVLQLAQNAAPDAVIAIRQSHIFPVKRAKS